MRRVAFLLLFLSACRFDFGRDLAPGELRGTAVVATAEGHTEPAAGTRVRLDGSRVSAVTDAQGRFVLRGLGSGSYRVRLEQDADGDGVPERRALLSVTFQPGEGARDLGRIEVGAVGSVRGTVRRAGEPVAGAVVGLRGETALATTSATGTFELKGLAAGSYDPLVVLAAQGWTPPAVTVRPRETTEMEVALDGLAPQTTGSLHGTVRLSDSTTTHDGVQLSLVGTAGVAGAAESGRDGEFSIAEVPAGVYALLATHPDYAAEALPRVLVVGDAEVPALLLVNRACLESAPPATCPITPEAQGDGDGDGVGDLLDDCPAVADPAQVDSDHDGIGDACLPTACVPRTSCDPAECGQQLPDGCGGALTCPACERELVEDFQDPAHFEAQMTAVLDPTLGARLVAPAGAALADPPLTAASAWTVTASGTSTGGTAEYTSVAFTGGLVEQVDGDFVLRAVGDVRLTGTGLAGNGQAAVLRVNGSLTVVAGGDVVLECAYLHATRGVRVEARRITIACSGNDIGEVAVLSESSGGGPGDVVLLARETLDVGANGYVSMGNRTTGPTGNLRLWAHGDVHVGPQGAYVVMGRSDLGGGSIDLRTEGSLTIDGDSYVNAGNGSGPGGDLLVRARGDVTVRNGSYLLAGLHGKLALSTAGTLSAETNGIVRWGDGGGVIEAGRVSVTGDAFFAAPGGATGPLAMRVAADLALDSGSIGLGSACGGNGASGRIDVGGNLTLKNFSSIRAGSAGCTPGVGGDLVVRVGGTITEEPADQGPYIRAGTGDTAGVLTREEGVTDPVVVEAFVVDPVWVVSKPQSAFPAVRQVTFDGLAPAGWPQLRLLLSPDGATTTWKRVPEQLGQPLPEGWRYRIELAPQLFEDTAVDTVTLRENART